MTHPSWPVGHGRIEIPPDAAVLALVFSRPEVVQAGVGRAVDDLMALIEDDRLRRQLAHGVVFIFEGWDNDPRPLHQIPECRRYFAALHALFPYWLHFLVPDPQMWAVLLTLLMDADTQGVQPGTADARVSMDEARSVINSMLTPMNTLHVDMALSCDERQSIFDVSLKAIQQCLK